MAQVIRKVGWKVDGQFITDLARSWYWNDGKGYQKAEELLLGCLICEQLSKEKLKKIAKDIIFGKSKLVGINTFSLEDDNYKPDIEAIISQRDKILENYQECQKDIENNYVSSEEAADMVKAVEEKYQPIVDAINKASQKLDPIYQMRVAIYGSNMIDQITFNKIFTHADNDEVLKQRFNDFCSEYKIYPCRGNHGFWQWVYFCDCDTNKMLDRHELISRGIAIKTEINKQEKTKVVEEPEIEDILLWGWLSPNGEFIEGDFGNHEEIASEIISNKKWENEYRDWQHNNTQKLSLCRDFLISVKGYVLVHNPFAFGNTMFTYKKALTKIQREFIYDYLIKEGRTAEANALYSE